MFNYLLFGFSFNEWWRGATRELANYYNQMDTAQWGIVAAMCVIAGFLLLRSSSPPR